MNLTYLLYIYKDRYRDKDPISDEIEDQNASVEDPIQSESTFNGATTNPELNQSKIEQTEDIEIADSTSEPVLSTISESDEISQSIHEIPIETQTIDTKQEEKISKLESNENLQPDSNVSSSETEQTNQALITPSHNSEHQQEKVATTSSEQTLKEQENEESVVPPSTEQPSNQSRSERHLVAAACGIQGRRDDMEDSHTVVPDLWAFTDVEESRTSELCAFYGVYDGHGGSRASEYLAEHLHKYVHPNPFHC